MNKWILGVSVILFLLTSCSKDNDEGTPQSDDIMNGGAELKFSSDVLSSIVVDVDPTRSSTRAPLSSFENNSQIGIYGIPGVDGGKNHVICVIVNLNPIFKNICLMVDIPMFLGMTNYNRNFRLHIHHEQILLYICMGIILIRTRRNIVKLPELLSGLFHGN